MTRWINELTLPLSNLMGSVELAQDQIEEKSFERIWRYCHDLQEALKRLLWVERIYREKPIAQWENMSMEEVLNRGVQGAEIAAQRRGVTIELTKGLPEAQVWSDPQLLGGAVEYLLRYLIGCSQEGDVILLGYILQEHRIKIWIKNKKGTDMELWDEEESGHYLELSRFLAAAVGAVVIQSAEEYSWELSFLVA